jgi:RNA-binding protein
MTIELTQTQKKQLRALGQSLQPTLQIGREGVTDSVGAALEPLLKRHELVKGRVHPGSSATPQEAASALALAANAALVGVVGRTFLLYRPNPERKDPIRLTG